MSAEKYKSPLHRMVSTTPTALWNDSCSLQELEYALENGAVGATSNPVIVGEVLKKEMHLWKGRIGGMIREMPVATEDEVTWRLIGEAGKGVESLERRGVRLLRPDPADPAPVPRGLSGARRRREGLHAPES
jgi:hypothetical protein